MDKNMNERTRRGRRLAPNFVPNRQRNQRGEARNETENHQNLPSHMNQPPMSMHQLPQQPPPAHQTQAQHASQHPPPLLPTPPPQRPRMPTPPQQQRHHHPQFFDHNNNCNMAQNIPAGAPPVSPPRFQQPPPPPPGFHCPPEGFRTQGPPPPQSQPNFRFYRPFSSNPQPPPGFFGAPFPFFFPFPPCRLPFTPPIFPFPPYVPFSPFSRYQPEHAFQRRRTSRRPQPYSSYNIVIEPEDRPAPRNQHSQAKENDPERARVLDQDLPVPVVAVNQSAENGGQGEADNEAGTSMCVLNRHQELDELEYVHTVAMTSAWYRLQQLRSFREISGETLPTGSSQNLLALPAPHDDTAIGDGNLCLYNAYAMAAGYLSPYDTIHAAAIAAATAASIHAAAAFQEVRQSNVVVRELEENQAEDDRPPPLMQLKGHSIEDSQGTILSPVAQQHQESADVKIDLPSTSCTIVEATSSVPQSQQKQQIEMNRLFLMQEMEQRQVQEIQKRIEEEDKRVQMQHLLVEKEIQKEVNKRQQLVQEIERHMREEAEQRQFRENVEKHRQLREQAEHQRQLHEQAEQRQLHEQAVLRAQAGHDRRQREQAERHRRQLQEVQILQMRSYYTPSPPVPSRGHVVQANTEVPTSSSQSAMTGDAVFSRHSFFDVTIAAATPSAAAASAAAASAFEHGKQPSAPGPSGLNPSPATMDAAVAPTNQSRRSRRTSGLVLAADQFHPPAPAATAERPSPLVVDLEADHNPPLPSVAAVSHGANASPWSHTLSSPLAASAGRLHAPDPLLRAAPSSLPPPPAHANSSGEAASAQLPPGTMFSKGAWNK